ncbi:MAG TPA: hypothetical protein PLX03_13730, partial [Candidatus Hydrogenedentes bacterium]|nr:hypothetical protein [Candidatus Hydrogenedentota bacterium]
MPPQKLILPAITAWLLVCAYPSSAEGNESAEPRPSQELFRDLYADTWVATDSLGRTVPGHEQAGPPRP